MSNYSKDTKINNMKTLKSYMDMMPDFCKVFLNGISNSTESLTQVAYCRDIYHFLTYIKHTNPFYKNTDIKAIPFDVLELLTSEDIDDYMLYLSSYEVDGQKFTYDNASKARKFSALNKMYTFYIKRKQLKNNPITAIERPKINEKDIITLNSEQVQSLIEVVKTPKNMTPRQLQFHHHTAIRDLAIMMVFLGTGIRVSELVGLDIDDIDFKEHSLRIVRKGGKEKFVFFGEQVADALTQYLGVNDESPEIFDERKVSPRHSFLSKTNVESNPSNEEKALFLSLRGRRISVKSVQVLVKKYEQMLKVNKKITPHKLRSTFGTELYNKTGDIYLTAEALGHKDINTTKRYYAAIFRNKPSTSAKNCTGNSPISTKLSHARAIYFMLLINIYPLHFTAAIGNLQSCNSI